ncbi:MAG: O-antigen ligase family protein [Ignavibacteriae bacterium]|nr:O-antigen ligase family protein [Ignavibacteriota bacterium]
MNFSSLKSDFKIFRIAYFSFFAILLLISNYFLIFGIYNYLILFTIIPIVVFLAFYFDKYFMVFFVVSLFIEHMFPYRIQIVNMVSYVVIIYFFLNQNSENFIQKKLPGVIAFSSTLFIIAVVLSSFLTPHFSKSSVYYCFGFIIYIAMFYVTYRYSNNRIRTIKMLDAFFYSTFVAGIIVIIFIIITVRIRGADISGYAYFDFAPVALLISVFSFFILGKSGNLVKISTLVIFITLVATLSRNSWIGFTLSFLYGVLVTVWFQKDLLNFLKKKITIFIALFVIAIMFLFFTGLNNFIFQRIGEINTSLFIMSDEGGLIKNSLETRILIWIVALNAFLHNPLTGVGYFMFYEVSEQYNVLPQFLYDEFVRGLDAHSTIMNFLCETGIIGLSSFIIYLISMLRISFKAIKISTNALERKTSIVLHIIVFFISIHSIYAGAFTLGQNAFQMYFFFGLAVANYVNLYKAKKNNIIL